MSNRYASCIVDCRNTLGEGCVWDPRDESLYWTDIEGKSIWRLLSDGAVASFALSDRVSFILPRRDPGFVVGFPHSIAIADPLFAEFETVALIEPQLPQTRVNDAAVDPYGGIVFGTFDERDRQPVASLYRLAPSGELQPLLAGGITISNGIAFSPQGDLMYFADTPMAVIRRFKIGPNFSSVQEVAPLAGPDIAPGRPDGAVVDDEGYYWNARVWGSCLVRISPDGRLTDRIDLPTKGPTCVALGGKAMTRLFATTLRVRHTPAELDMAPQAGGVFALDVDQPGQPSRLSLL